MLNLNAVVKDQNYICVNVMNLRYGIICLCLQQTTIKTLYTNGKIFRFVN